MDIERIVKLREDLKLSRAAMAREIGVNVATLWRWETGKFEPTPLAARQLERVLQRLERRTRAAAPEGTPT